MRQIGALLAVVVLGLSACGVSDGDASPTAPGGPDGTTSGTEASTTTQPEGPTDDSRASYSVAWSAAYQDIDNNDRCLAGRLVDAIGVERLNEAGITPEAFASDDIVTPLDLDDAERDALAADATAAIVACHNAERLATEWLSSEEESEDLTTFAGCVAEPLAPLLSQIIMEGFAGERSGDVVDAVSDALEVADSGCAELQVEVAARAVAEDGPPLTDDERACILQAYEELAQEGRALTGEDDETIASTCLAG